MLNIVLFGPPGAGKGTQSEKMIRKYGLTHISTGELLRKHMCEGTELGKTAQKYIDEGRLVPDELVVEMVDLKIEENKDTNGFIFDGFPRTVVQAEALDRLLIKKNQNITLMVALEVQDSELISRLMERGKTSGRSDDQNIEKINTRIHVYKKETLPVINYYDKQGKFSPINGVGSIESIFDSICTVIDKKNAKV
jgi:adenylate kinase